MIHILKRKITLMLLLLLSVMSSLWSGTTGKISGVVTDKATNEPLISVNVVVVGTQFGAITNLDGEYTILSVPPGTYSVQVSSVGFKKIIINDVRVYIDQTARINAALDAQTVELGATVITAERKLVRPDVATSVVAISSDEVKSLPVTNVGDVVGLQAGIQGLSIRGSSWEQSLFMVDGVTLRDPRNNQPVTKVAMSSVREISVERGGMTAEYGQVQAGIINVVTREGKPKGYSGSFNIKMTPPSPKYYRGNGIPDINDKNSYWLRPFYDPAVCWTGTDNGAWDIYTKKEYASFGGGWNQVSETLLKDNNPNNDVTPLGAQRAFEYETRKRMINNQPDYDFDAGFGGPVPFISEDLGDLRFFASYRKNRSMLLYPSTRPDYSDYDARIVVNSDLSPSMGLMVTGLTGNVATMEDNWNKGYYPSSAGDLATSDLYTIFTDMNYSLTDISHKALSAKLTHKLSDQTIYELSAEYFNRKYYSRPTAARDTSIKYEVFPGYYETANPFGYYTGISDGVWFNSTQGGFQSLARDNSNSSATTIKGNISSQLNFSNLAKAGFEFVYNNLNLDYGFLQMQSAGSEKYSTHVQMHNFPIRASAYLQDKLETKGFVLNIGVRADYSDARTDWWSFGDFDKNFYSDKFATSTGYAMKKSEAQWQISPRLGISHPVTENSKLYFNYGHYKQMPQYEALFRNDRRQDGSLSRIGDPNMTLAKTVSYELGYDHQLFDNMLLIQLSAFYRDISDQQSSTTYFPIVGGSYSVTTSNNYQDVRGFELTLRKQQGEWFNGFVNYTYQASSDGHFGTSELYENPEDQVKKYDEVPSKYYQNRYIPSPYARANLNFSTPQDFGPEVLGHKILGNWLVNLLLNWGAGGWTTYNPLNIAGVSNNIQYVDYFDGVLRTSKTINMKYFNIQLYADVSNLFNALRLRDSYDRDYRASLHLPKSNAYDNIVGDDKFGDYRKPGVEWVPMESRPDMSTIKNSVGNTRAVYYEAYTGKYWHYVDDPNLAVTDRWQLVDKKRIDQINEDKAYIFNPGPSTFWFLYPRNITYGIRVSFDIN